MNALDLRLTSLRERYLAGTLAPARLCAEIAKRCDATVADNIWIHRLTSDELAPYLARLKSMDPATLPLYGIPFAIKDNIDLAGIPTTAGCPAFAYVPASSAFVVERLIEAGAIPIGKTNLDQFATGLTGTRSPFGATRNAFNPNYIAGGSSAGSAVACAKNLVSFALGTDTAGSGRVPAAFNNLIGVKPTRGRLSARGVVPACRSLDTVSIFARSLQDAAAVLQEASIFDPDDPYARPVESAGSVHKKYRVGVPRQLEFRGDADAERLFRQLLEQLWSRGGEIIDIDFAPFLAAARLLYAGPWVAERYAAIKSFITEAPEALHPITRAIIEPAKSRTAVEAFEAQYELQRLKRTTDTILAGLDYVLTPTTPTIFTFEELARDPIELNNALGHYTNFMNLLDYAAVAVPSGIGSHGVPYGATLFGPAHSDERLIDYAARLLDEPPVAVGDRRAAALNTTLKLVVCGAHMSNLPLNSQLLDRGARLVHAAHTAPTYRLFALPGGPPARPGLVRVEAGGAAIAVEVWELPTARFGDFIQAIPAPLAIGTVALADGSALKGFLCEAHATTGARDITEFGGWRDYLISI